QDEIGVLGVEKTDCFVAVTGLHGLEGLESQVDLQALAQACFVFHDQNLRHRRLRYCLDSVPCFYVSRAVEFPRMSTKQGPGMGLYREWLPGVGVGKAGGRPTPRRVCI